MLLDIREWTCPSCKMSHHRDGNAAIRAEGIRMFASSEAERLQEGGTTACSC
jgi:putative transposase